MTFILASRLSAQSNNSLYQNGKIYVVVIVIAIILTGLFIYLFSIDRKLNKIEDKIHSDE